MSQANHLATGVLTSLDDRHHASFPHARVNLIDTTHFQGLGDPPRGVQLFKAQFRVGMEVTPKGRQLGVKGCNLREGAAFGMQARSRDMLGWVCHQRLPPEVRLDRRRRGSTTK